MSENTHLDKMLDKLVIAPTPIPVVDPWPTVAVRPTRREMRLELAIEILKWGAEGNLTKYTWKEEQAAAGLGYEALKRLQDNRRDPEFDHWIPLPGETQEDACTAKDS